MKKYGIYLAYAPTVDLRREGLGRYLAAFLKGASRHEDVEFTIVCPSWSIDSLKDLFIAEGVPHKAFKIVAPTKQPPILRVYNRWFSLKKKLPRPSTFQRTSAWAKKGAQQTRERVLKRLVGSQTTLGFLLNLLPAMLLGAVTLLLTPIWLIASTILLIRLALRKPFTVFLRHTRQVNKRVEQLRHQPKEDGLVTRMYQEMFHIETRRMQNLINGLSDVNAWYSPTAFWPTFNEIQAPRLTCVPDVVLSDFAIGFSSLGGDRFLQTFEMIESSITGGNYFVTYSNNVKWETLVDRYSIRSNRIAVIHHAPNDLSDWVSLNSFENNEEASRHYCRILLKRALSTVPYAANFQNGDLKFLFYASQIRPNKNVITLLRAYEHLLRKNFITHKLILSGNPKQVPEIYKYIVKYRLQNDVLCLPGLTVQELAACYKLADLAVNPSLSEGGCPFTFTEALSVDTPVVMARIPVTEEILTDPELREMTFFDPYDWQDLVKRIEWALEHRDELLAVQRKTYAELAKRTWADVVDEHLQVLDRISQRQEIALT
jgi:glycosyltransferase involved in cell wall biosynthesis